MHTLRQPFAAAANHFLELRLDFGEAGPSTAMIALPRLQRRLRRSEGRTRARARAWSRARSQDPRCQRATSLVTRERRGEAAPAPAKTAPEKAAEASRNPEVRELGRPKASSEQQKGGGGGIAQAATPAAATFRRSAGARARCGAKTTCTKKDPAAGEGARRCGAACGAASAGSSSSLAQERICGDC